jgi:transposase-like protein
MPEVTVAKRRGKAKFKIEAKRKAAMAKIIKSYSEEANTKLAVIQELIPLGLKAVAEVLQEEVKQIAGHKHARTGDNARWGRQPGSVYLRDQKLPVLVPRVRNVAQNTEVPLETYRRLQNPFRSDDGTIMRLLHGLSTHRYEESSSLASEAFGISASNLSKRFKRGSARVLKQLQERSLAPYDLVAVIMDSKRYADDGIAVALGITIDGRKIVLGIEQMHSENSLAVEQWLDGFINRGLRYEDGILFVIDGSKGIRKGIERKFGPYALIQRCRWHKRENVASYLDDGQKDLLKVRMENAYAKTTFDEAEGALHNLQHELSRINQSAAKSLEEGLEETLTLHKLGLAPELKKHLGTTNMIESVMSQMGQHTDKVDRWHNSDQIMRWTAASLTDLEPRLRRMRGFRYLKLLKIKLKEIVAKRLEKNDRTKTRGVLEPVEV